MCAWHLDEGVKKTQRIAELDAKFRDACSEACKTFLRDMVEKELVARGLINVNAGEYVVQVRYDDEGMSAIVGSRQQGVA